MNPKLSSKKYEPIAKFNLNVEFKVYQYKDRFEVYFNHDRFDTLLYDGQILQSNRSSIIYESIQDAIEDIVSEKLKG